MATDTPDPDIAYLRGLAEQRQAALRAASEINEETREAVAAAHADGDGMSQAELAAIFAVKRQQISTWVVRQRELVDELAG